jgi:hypothetical protein
LAAGNPVSTFAEDKGGGGKGKAKGEAGAEQAKLPTPGDKALAAKVLELAEQAVGTPGQEWANMMQEQWPQMVLSRLQGEADHIPKSLDRERRLAEGWAGHIANGIDWPDPGTFTIPKRRGKLEIDGVLEKAWGRALTFEGVHPFNQTTRLEEPGTVWRVLWDRDNLYFAFECDDTDVQAPEIERDGNVYFHDCVEMFILGDFRMQMYWELVISPSGSVFDALHAKASHRWGAAEGRIGESCLGLRHAQVVRGTLNDGSDTDAGYTVEVAVPFDQICSYTRGNRPKRGDVLHMMLVRLDKNGDKLEAYGVRPLSAWGHNIWNHIEFELGR